MRANIKFLGYAETATCGYKGVNDYMAEHMRSNQFDYDKEGWEFPEWTNTECACGQTECVYFMNTEYEECCIVICDACYNNNPSERLY